MNAGRAACILHSIQAGGSAVPDYSRTTFVFTRELGSRLRKLRRRRGLSLRDMALLMDRRGPGSYNQLGRLERGDVKRPSFNLIADYLRACGSGFGELGDLLDAYTRQKPVLKAKGDAAVAVLLKGLPGPEQRAMLRWEKASVAAREERAASGPQKKPRVETPRQRVFRIVWAFIHANWNEVFEQKLYEALLRLGPAVPRSRRKRACGFGRRMFSVMTRHYASEKRRENALALVERRAKEDGFPGEVVSALLGAAAAAHSELATSGRLEWEPMPEQIVASRGRAPRVERAETRMELDEIGPGLAYNRALGLVRVMVLAAVNSWLEKQRLDFRTRRSYLLWIERLVPVAVKHGTDSPEWRADVEATVPKMHDPELAKAVAGRTAEAFNRWKVRIPARPERPGRP